MHYTIYTDGGARGNPGPAGVGIVIESEGKKIKLKEFIGTATNNQAEYRALILALKHILENFGLDGSLITAYCFLDSELVVKQLNGEYKVKHEGIKPLYNQIKKLSSNFREINFRHIPRQKNKIADRLVNEAIDSNLKK